ncbi:MAG: helix-turn-helix domain-containing protein [Gloeotrichia echinulata GP01]
MKWLKTKDNQQPTFSVEQQRSEKLAQMGAQLWASRQEQGLSLEEMVVMTRIPRRLLQAIEEGNLNDLPEPIYIQGLIRQFSDALGFNGAEFASNFPIAYERVNLPTTWKTQSISQLRPLHLYLLYIFLIVCSVSGLSQLLNNAALQANNTESKPKSEQDSLLESVQSQSEQGSPIKPFSNTLSSTNNGQPVEIGVTLKASSWIRVVADGKTAFEGTLPQGTHRTWNAEKQLIVKTDNAGGVLMSVNQQEAKQMGELGKVQEIQIAAKPRF